MLDAPMNEFLKKPFAGCEIWLLVSFSPMKNMHGICEDTCTLGRKTCCTFQVPLWSPLCTGGVQHLHAATHTLWTQ